MPHPKNRLKLTGDTHLPDAGLDMHLDDDEPIDMAVFEEEEVRVYSDGYVPEAEPTSTRVDVVPARVQEPMPEPQGVAAKLEQKVERQTARTPLLAMSAALFFGWMVTRMLRR
jgi:hypothetical protein